MRKSYIPKTYKNNHIKISRKKSNNIFSFFLKSIIFISIIGGIGYILYSPILNINSFEIRAENENLQKEITSKTQDLVISQTYWWYNNKNIFLLRSDKLEKYLLDEFPQIKNIVIKRKILDKTLEINVNLRNPAFITCENEICYNVSEDGVNMGVFPNNETASLTRLTGINPKSSGDKVLLDREISWLKTILQEYNNIDSIKINSLDIQQKSGDEIVSLFVYTEQGYYIILDLDTDVTYQAQALKQVFISQLPIEKRSELEYIDLRIKDRVYYKFR